MVIRWREAGLKILETSRSGWSGKRVRRKEGTLPEKLRLRLAVAGTLVLLAAVAGLPPHSPAQEPGLLYSSASGEFSAALPELSESLRAEWVEQERHLLDSFEQQALEIGKANRAFQRELRENAAEARLQAREDYREDLRKLREEHNEKMRRVSAALAPKRYQSKREDLREDHQDDLEDLKTDQERLINEIGEDLEGERDDSASELEQALFDIRTEQQYALEQLKAEKLETLLQHYQRQLEMEALRKIIPSLGVGPSGDQVVFEVLDYLRDQVYIEASRKDLGLSRIRITVRVGADSATIDQAMELFGLSGAGKTPGEGLSPGIERVP
jgi:hypothetical protein